MNKAAHKWDALSSRERWLVIISAVVIPVVLIYIALIEPSIISLQHQHAKSTDLKIEMASKKQVLDLLRAKEPVDPNIAVREELKRLRLELTNANADIRRAATNLVSPDQMLSMLKDVLKNEQGVSLLSAKSLAVETLELGGNNTNTKSGSSTPSAVIYAHPFEIELQGNYQGIYDYLQKIEQLDGVFFWDTLNYAVDEYPAAKVKIRVHTLSSEARWLGA
ncbi:type II secretion system protein GspM [Neptuniibacter marinus]|uniref:type II secretion system protein GspM n=1 Tax=Neptuniibacter marinus TaxID=1806670 RepID=UPI00082C3437|nr:type II secretion system protein GspM [Neptuniibacter marinus]